MHGFLATILNEAAAEGCLGWLAENSIKTSVVLLAVVAAVLCLRAAAPRARYQLLSLAFIGVFAIPLLSHVLPTWTLPALTKAPEAKPPPPPIASVDLDVLRAEEPAARGDGPASFFTLAEWDEAAMLGLPLPKPGSTFGESIHAAEAPTAAAGISWPVVLVSVWAFGIAIVMGWLGIGLWRVRSLTRRGRPLDHGTWPSLIAQARERVGVTRPIRLLVSSAVTTPMTWGARRPVVLLPAAAEHWCEERRKLVIFHELVHVKRLDWVVHTLVLFTAALHWFNPLVWLAGRELAVERERACDDDVLDLGTKPSVYATHLVEIARTMTSLRSLPAPALAMAARSRLELRLETILRKPGAPPVRARSVTITLLLCAVIVLVGTLRPASASPAEEETFANDGAESTGVVNEAAGGLAAPKPLLAPVSKPTRSDAFRLLDRERWFLAATAFGHLAAENPRDGEAWFFLGYGLHRAGYLEQALKVHAKAAEFPKYRKTALYNVACAEALLGRAAAALESLERALDAGFDSVKLISRDPDLSSIRGLPGFRAIQVRVVRCKRERPDF